MAISTLILKMEILAKTSNFGGYQICQQTVHRISTFLCISNYNRNEKVKLASSSKKLIKKSQNNDQRPEIDQ